MATDKFIADKVSDPANGSWSSEGEMQIYTPKMSFFTDVDPHELLVHFLNRDPDANERLNLP